MSDRTHGFVVTLEEGAVDEERDAIIAAMKMVRGVIDVQPAGGSIEVSLATARARHDLGKRFYDFYLGLVKG